MHVPAKEKIDDTQVIHQIIQENSFALLVSSSLLATHLPLQLASQEGQFGTLYGHVAKANVHSQFTDGEQVLAVFSGPHSYISPTWYKSAIAVPTWNYVAVHCHGNIEKLDAKDTLNQVKQLISQYEPELLNDPARMPEAYQQKLLKGITGFKVTINHIDAREKLGQHKNLTDQAGVFNALKQSKQSNASALTHYMHIRNLGTGTAK